MNHLVPWLPNILSTKSLLSSEALLPTLREKTVRSGSVLEKVARSSGPRTATAQSPLPKDLKRASPSFILQTRAVYLSAGGKTRPVSADYIPCPLHYVIPSSLFSPGFLLAQSTAGLAALWCALSKWGGRAWGEGGVPLQN